MSKTILTEGDEGVRLIVRDRKKKGIRPSISGRSPVHVVYGGADRFAADTPAKLGRIAIATLAEHTPNFVEFADAMHIPGTEGLPRLPDVVAKIESRIASDPQKARKLQPDAWVAWTVYEKILRKLESEPVEDFRIDFEDGYGFRTDEEEDADAVRTANETAAAMKAGSLPPFFGIRVRSFAPASYGRAKRTLEKFLGTLTKTSEGSIPENFVVTLPKVTDKKQVREMCSVLKKIEKKHGISSGSIGLEIMIETAEAIFDRKGNIALPGIVSAAKGRCSSVHFGAYDYTSALGISSRHQALDHPACDFARQIMLASLAPAGIRLVDSVTTELPVPLHRGNDLTEGQQAENRRAIHTGWRIHFQNVSKSMANGFYRSWDLHPNQLPARYAAVYFFYLDGFDIQAKRLRRSLDMSAKASLTGNVFDDAASVRGIVTFMQNAFDCGAVNEDEIKIATGLSSDELKALDLDSFVGG